MRKFCLLFIIAILTGLTGCTPLISGNYLGPTTIQTSQKINNTWLKPKLVILNAETLNTQSGHQLVTLLMRAKPYRVGAYDNLNVIVWGHPELSTLPTASYTNSISTNTMTNAGVANPSIIVDANGMIFFPYVGNLYVQGLTVSQIQHQMTKRLSSYIIHPQVTVQVANYRNSNIYVLGEVRHPGAQPLTDKPLNIMSAISNAGDINTDNADPTHIYLIRGSYQQPYVYWLNATMPQALLIATRIILKENDIIYVSSASLTGWNRFINQVLPSLQGYLITKEFAR